MVGNAIVIAHAWRWEGGHQTYATPGIDPVDGWCAYVRRPLSDEPDGRCDVEELGDFPDRSAAIEAAQPKAISLNASLCIED